MTIRESVITAIRRQKTAAKPVIGCFPLYPPVELFSAMGLLPVVLWNLKMDVPDLTVSDRHIQNYACGIARELVQFTLTDTEGLLDGIFSCNACDTLRNLPEVLVSANADSGRTVPMLRMHIPQVDRTQTDPGRYLHDEIEQLIGSIESAFGTTFSAQSFQRTIDAYAGMRDLCREAETLVARGALAFSGFCATILSGCFLSVEEQTANLSRLIAGSDTVPASTDTGVVVSGIMPPPASVMQAMEKAGLRVVANDIASLRRTYGYTPARTDDPGVYYSDFYANRFPCTTLLYRADARRKAFLDLVAASAARGVIFCGEKFCEYEYFEFPYLEQRLRDQGIPVLRLEFGVDDVRHTGAYATRIQAFAEQIT